jgi:hypothetical protein
MDSIASKDIGSITGIESVQILRGHHAGRQEIDRGYLLDPGICWQALYSRDRRFDGRFFAGATTTGLYCRNICPVPFAKP